MKLLGLIAAALLVAVLPAAAQTPPVGTPGQKFAWEQPAPDLAAAQGYTYKYYADGSLTGVDFVGVVCTGTVSPFACEVPIPAFTPTSHVLVATATNIAGESPKSAPFSFTFVATPGTLINFRIK